MAFLKMIKKMPTQNAFFKTDKRRRTYNHQVYKTSNIASRKRSSSIPMRYGEGGAGCFVLHKNAVHRYLLLNPDNEGKIN